MYIEDADVTWRRNFLRLLKKWKAEGHTYREFMDKVGVSYAAFYNWRVGRRTPGLDYITRMARAFNVPTEYFFRR